MPQRRKSTWAGGAAPAPRAGQSGPSSRLQAATGRGGARWERYRSEFHRQDEEGEIASDTSGNEKWVFTGCTISSSHVSTGTGWQFVDRWKSLNSNTHPLDLPTRLLRFGLGLQGRAYYTAALGKANAQNSFPTIFFKRKL